MYLDIVDQFNTITSVKLKDQTVTVTGISSISNSETEHTKTYTHKNVAKEVAKKIKMFMV